MGIESKIETQKAAQFFKPGVTPEESKFDELVKQLNEHEKRIADLEDVIKNLGTATARY